MTTVAERSKASAAAVSRLEKHRALWGGTQAMRDAGTIYLPKFEAEDDAEYLARKSRSFLYNGYRKTVKDMAGRVFEKPVTLEDAETQVEEWAQDIDLQGRHVSNFALEVFLDVLKAGVSYILVDAPRREGRVTRRAAAAQNLRPYFIHLRVEDILGWKSESINNKQVLTQLRVMETISEPDQRDEFAENEIHQVRVFDLDGRVNVRVFRKGTDGKWALHDEYPTEAEEISLVPVYGARTGFLTGEPPLDDLAWLNIAHWQSASDQRHIMHVARVPILWGAGWNEEQTLKVGSSVAQITNSPANEVSLQYAEHSGQAIGAGHTDLKELEWQMQTFGLQLLAERSDGGATGAVLDAKKETSQLAMMADNLEDALNQALELLADFGGVSAPTCSVHKDFASMAMGVEELNFMLQAVNTGNMTRKTFLEELVRRGAVNEDLDVDEEIEELGEGELPPVDDGIE